MDNESFEPLTRKEHNQSAAAKKVQIRGLQPSDGQYYNVAVLVAGSTPVLPIAVVDSSGNQIPSFAQGTSSTLYTDQRTVSTSAVQLSLTSKPLGNGVIVKSLSTNSDNIYVGLTGVTTSTGDILEPGESRGYAISNINLLYIISATSTTDVVSYEGN